jgi:hypothetical protein
MELVIGLSVLVLFHAYGQTEEGILRVLMGVPQGCKEPK